LQEALQERPVDPELAAPFTLAAAHHGYDGAGNGCLDNYK
jgi:hypothetical protein